MSDEEAQERTRIWMERMKAEGRLDPFDPIELVVTAERERCAAIVRRFLGRDEHAGLMLREIESGDMTTPNQTTVTLTRDALSRLITLCDARAHNLRILISQNLWDDDVSDERDDVAFLETLASTLRGARGF